MHMTFTTEGFLEVSIEIWHEWDMNPRIARAAPENTEWWIIMRIHITPNTYTVNKIWKMKNKQKHTNIYKTESMQKYYLSYFIRKLRFGERK